MTLTVPTTLKEWRAISEEDGPFLLVSRADNGIPLLVSTNGAGECESFQTLDGAILWALGMIDVRTSPQGEEEAARQRHLYDREGQAILFLAKRAAELEKEDEDDIH